MADLTYVQTDRGAYVVTFTRNGPSLVEKRRRSDQAWVSVWDHANGKTPGQLSPR